MKGISLALGAVIVMASFASLGFSVGLNPMDPKDALKDSDGDGLSNLKEFQMGCDPYDPDSDGDGMPDGWEGFYRENPTLYDYDGDGTPDRTFVGDVIAGYEFDPVDPLDALSDPDDDGLTNLEEYKTGTDPSSPNTDWDRFVTDSDDPAPLIQDSENKAVFGGSMYHPYLGPLALGRECPLADGGATAKGQASSSAEGSAGGRALKYITRVIVDSQLPTSVLKGQEFMISGHVEASAVQVDDGSGNQGNGGNGNNGQNQGQGQGQQQGQGQGQGQQQGQGQGQGQGNGQGNGQSHGPWQGQGGEGGENGPGHGDTGEDKPVFYWYWWHGPLDEAGRSMGRDSSEWHPIDQPMSVSIQLNTSQGVWGIGSGLANMEMDGQYGHFQIACMIPGAAPGGEGKLVVHALGNSNFAGSWWEEGRDG